jgi:predicted Zn-dependent protease
LQVQDYLQRRLLTVQPNPMMPGRPGAFRLRVLSTTTPNALALNDGTILVTTGLLTTLKTETQLHAVMAHEVAHVVLDHALDGYRAKKKRSKARKVLGTIVGGVTSVVTPGFGGSGSLESTAYGLSSDLATQYLDREFIASAGLEYNQSQETEAIRLAQQWLMAHDAPPEALYTALQALQRDSRGRSASHGASFMDSHPGTSDRRATLASIIEAEGGDPSVLDDPAVPVDSGYDTAIAAVLEHEAEMDLAARRFYAAHEALDRALRTDWTTPRTSLFKAIAVRNTTTTAAGRREALDLLDAAERAAETPEPRIEAERALWRVRQGRPEAARRHLTRCRRQIEELRSTTPPEDPSSTAHDSLYAWASTLETRLRE